jgi:type I restriction enzyme, R subunit
VLFSEKKALGMVEAKPDSWGVKITTVEEQFSGYATAQLKWVKNSEPLNFIYEATGVLTRFTDARDPKPRSREVFSFHRPETLREWGAQPQSFRAALQELPPLNEAGLHKCQVIAIKKLEASLQEDRPRALVQMATGSGKTFTAITEVYRLLKFAGARRVLFLVDTSNLGEEAEEEFMSFVPNDDNRKFTELYTVQRLNSSFISPHARICISTIQRMYSILKDEPLPDGAEDETRLRDERSAKNPCQSFTIQNCRPNSSMSSSSTNVTARSTTCGDRAFWATGRSIRPPLRA